MDTREWIPITLPSRGVYYMKDGECLCPEGRVEITPWTTAQESAMVRRGSSGWDMIHSLLSENVRLPQGIQYGDLLLTDCTFLLIQLRAKSLIPIYTFQYQCPDCRHRSDVDVNLEEMETRVPAPGEMEPFEVELPRSRLKVSLRFLRIGDNLLMDEYLKKKSSQDPAAGTRFRLARHITLVNGDALPLQEKMDIVRNLILLDVHAMERTIQRYETGVVQDVAVSCPQCGFEETLQLPLDEHFFRPRPAEIDRALRMARESGNGHALPGASGVWMAGRTLDGELAHEELHPHPGGSR
jgi:hypothetical protein